jgi:type I restriction enzyme S subunit
MQKWKTVKLGDLLVESKVESINPNTQKRIRVKLNVGGVEKRPDINEKDGATKYFIRKSGQFIYGKQNLHKGAFGIIPEELDSYESSSDLPSFDVDKSCLPEWIFYFFKQGNFYQNLESIARGVGSKRINPSQIFSLNIKLPTLSEQKRIINLVNEFEEKVLKFSKESDFQIELINKLKNTVTRDAVEGKLTKSWREKNQNQDPIKNLIREIILEKAKLISLKKAPKETLITSIDKKDYPYHLPDNWTWGRLINLVHTIDAGKSPQCENRPANIDEWGVLKTTAIQKFQFLEIENKALPKSITPDPKIEVNVGDVLITRAGPKNRVGIVCAITSTRPKLLLSDKIIRLRVSSEFVNPRYLAIALSTGASSDFWETKKSGMAESQVNISQNNIKLTPVPMMPYQEQVEIVKKVDSLLELYNDIELNILNTKKNLDLYIQSYLKEIFGTNSNNVFKTPETINKTNLNTNVIISYNGSNMELDELLKNNTRLSAIDLWKMSKYHEDIDSFYEALKLEIEVNLSIKESVEKGFLELRHEDK